MTEIEKVIKACKYAIGDMIKRGSCSFTSTDEDGYRYVISWVEVIESLDKIRELQSNTRITNGGLFVPLAEVEALQREFHIERDRLLEQIKELQAQIPKWHLVADNDFPTNDDDRFYLCISENHEEDIPTMFQYDSELVFGWWHDIYDQHTLGFVDSEFCTVEEEHLEKVIAWMELPKFEDK